METVKSPGFRAVMATKRLAPQLPVALLESSVREPLSSVALAIAIALPTEGSPTALSLVPQSSLLFGSPALEPLLNNNAFVPCAKFDSVKSIPVIVIELQSSAPEPDKLRAKVGAGDTREITVKERVTEAIQLKNLPSPWERTGLVFMTIRLVAG